MKKQKKKKQFYNKILTESSAFDTNSAICCARITCLVSIHNILPKEVFIRQASIFRTAIVDTTKSYLILLF